MSDGSVAGTIQFGGTGPVRLAHLPINTIRVSSTAVLRFAEGHSVRAVFSVDKTDEVSFRGAVSGMGFAYCDFHKHGNAIVETRSRVHGPRRLGPPSMTRSADAGRAEVPKSEAKVEPKPGAGWHAGTPPLAGLIFSTPVGLRTSLRWGEVPSACR